MVMTPLAAILVLQGNVPGVVVSSPVSFDPFYLLVLNARVKAVQPDAPVHALQLLARVDVIQPDAAVHALKLNSRVYGVAA